MTFTEWTAMLREQGFDPRLLWRTWQHDIEAGRTDLACYAIADGAGHLLTRAVLHRTPDAGLSVFFASPADRVDDVTHLHELAAEAAWPATGWLDGGVTG